MTERFSSRFFVPSLVLAAVVMAALALGGAACGAAAADSASSTTRVTTVQALSADTTIGQSLFAANCATCHGTDATSGSAHRDLPSIATSDPTAAIDQILNGGGGMPSFSSLTDQQIADLVGYLQSL